MNMMMRRLLLALALGATGAQAQIPKLWSDTITPFPVIGNIHYVGSAGLSAWLITTPAGHILLDVGLPQNAAAVERSITQLGFRPSDVRIILNTHAHYDHSGGIAQLKRRTGARLFAMAGDRVALEQGVYVGSESDTTMRFPPVRVDSVLADGATVTIGGTTLTAHLTAGHSAGCTTWTMPLVVAGQRHTAVFYCSGSVAANRLAPVPQYPGIVEDYQRTFVRLREIDGDVFLAPHAEFFDLQGKRARRAPSAPNPFIDPGAFQRLVAEQSAAFSAALARQREAR